MNQNNSEETKKFNIAIVQAFDKNIREYAEYSRLINALYAYQKGYTYISFEDDLVPVHVSAYYNKILAIQRVFSDSRNFDWIFYLDSDAVVSNFNYTIEEIIVRNPDKELFFAQDLNGKYSGVILTKNTSLMQEFFQAVYTNNKFFHTKTPEESAMFEEILQPRYNNKVCIEPAGFLNAYLNVYPRIASERKLITFWNENSFILHLFRLSAEDRIAMFKDILSKHNILCISGSKLQPRLHINPLQVGPATTEAI